MRRVGVTIWKLVRSRRAARWSALVLLFALSGWYFNRPIPGATEYPLGDVDQLFQLATLEWERWSLLNQPGSFFSGLSFYGMGESLYFSDLLLGALPIYMLLAAVFGPVLGFNLLHAVLVSLNGLVMFGALRRLTGRPLPALVGAAIFAFSPVQMRFGQHLQLQMLLGTAAMVWFLAAYAQTRKPWLLGAATVSFSVQFATAVYPGYFAFLTLAALLGGVAGFGLLRLSDWRNAVWSLVAAVAGLLPLLPIIAGYREFEGNWQIARDIREIEQYSAGLPKYLSESLLDQWWVGAVGRAGGGAWIARLGLPVIMPLALAAAGVYYAVRQTRLRWVVAGGTVLTVVSVVLSLGPELRWGGNLTGTALPYKFLFETFPEFRALRVAARFAMPAMMGIALLAAVGMDGIWRWAGAGRARRYALPAGLGLLLVLEFARGPVAAGELPQREELTDALASTGGPVIFVPADISIWEEPIRMWVTARARTQMVNGYSGFKPPAYEQLATLVDETGVAEIDPVIAALHAYGVRTVVLDSSRMSAAATAGWIEAAGGPASPPAEPFVVLALGEGGGATPRSDWEGVDMDFFVTGIAAGEELAAPAFVRNRSAEPWLPPDGNWARPTVMTWTDADGGTRVRAGELLRVPPVIPGNAGMQIDGLVRAVAPAKPGAYTLSLTVDGQVLAERSITVFAAAPTSPGRDAAEVVVLQMSRESRPDWPAILRVAALNTGDTEWDGSYRVGYRWLRPGEDGVQLVAEGRLFFAGAPHPGSAEITGATIVMPAEPGFYLLEYGVVHEGIEWLTTASAGVTVIR